MGDVRRAVDRPAQERAWTFRRWARAACGPRPGVEVQAGALKRAIAAQLEVPGERRRQAARGQGASRRSRLTSSRRSTRPTSPWTATPYQLRVLPRPEAREDLQDRGRPGRLRDAGGPVRHPEQGGGPGLAACPSDWAGSLAGKVIPGGTPENPLKSRWMGIYDGAGIHGTDDVGLTRHLRFARLHPDGDPGGRGALRQGAGRHAGLHRLAVAPHGSSAPISLDRHLLPSRLREGGLAARCVECTACR